VFRPVAFLDSAAAKRGRYVDGLPVHGGLEQWPTLRAKGLRHVIVAVGDNHARVSLARELQRAGAELVSAVHPLATIAPSAQLGEHLIVGARVTVCVHARIGPHCVLSPGSIIEHDNCLGMGVFLEPAVRLAGTVTADDFARVGIGACVIPGRRLGVACRVAPGAVVIRDVPAGATVTGVPAKEDAPEGSRFVADEVPALAVASA
jgi:UDP-perosamine 4-acetyltransferase